MRTTCLLGNGVSLAYNADLRVEQLTADLLKRFARLGATEPERALAAYAAHLAAAPGEHFETLLGPLESTSKALGYMPGLAGLTNAASDDIAAALNIAADFLGAVHRIGTAVTLGHIAERSIGGNYWDGPWPVAKAVIKLGRAGDLTVGTLNYDGLLHSGLMDAGTDERGRTTFPIADLADGRESLATEVEVVPGHRIMGHPLRRDADMPEGRATLLQLHGSLGWLRNTVQPDRAFKFNLPDLRDIGYWERRQAGNTSWGPLVVLTDRKDTAIGGWPYSLAYSTFLSRLLSAERWLIAGYGLGDAPVNALFAAAVRERHRMGGAGTPPTLVVGHAESADELRARTTRELGLDERAVVANTDGVPEVFESDAWRGWAGLESDPCAEP